MRLPLRPTETIVQLTQSIGNGRILRGGRSNRRMKMIRNPRAKVIHRSSDLAKSTIIYQQIPAINFGDRFAICPHFD